MILKKNNIMNWLPVIIWMIIIFMFSAQPASQSNQLSVGFTKVLVETLGKIFPFDIETNTLSNFVAQLNHTVRKFAHFSIYLVLGILVSRALIKSKASRAFLISFLICALYATTDEFHQLFVPGRGCQVKDVIIDSMGAFVGITLSTIVYKLKRI